ncbi:valine--tRNA ligase [Desulfovermiculus halophilus]|uniref:valine--tRNA ligase n=1 Tax=Desulfovermiculus halophilus TaxID=339722 RepID=UPI00047F5E94|nr:valine--tRNA ligase [Desulfovermiculus halophilus]
MNNASLSKGYEPQNVEDRWLRFWDEAKTFTPDPDSDKDPFSIVIPPPNVTGTLHMGHALNLTLQDVLCRYKRQQGYNVLWVPGTDHAGIATQNVVEKALAREGTSREELGREKFVDRVWEWKQEYGDKILNQIQRMGASVDWSRLRFTMDDGLSRAVREVFVRLYEQGLIYQGDYIINWCPRCQTALADLEVEHEDMDGGLYHLRYPVVDGDQEIIIATTRPETMLGDTAVAVHPEDERYAQLIGREVELPLVGRKIPVIADPYVDREFGTGCLKVTPAHDPNDFELGNAHGLEFIRVIDENGRMAPEAGEAYAGMDRFQCRRQVVQDLKDQGFLIKQEPYRHKVGQCYRCQTVIEPAVSTQWFVATSTLAAKAKAAVDRGDTRIFPANWKNLYDEWLDTIRDWCISRQIWWGHRIPAWTCRDCGRLIVAREDPDRCPSCQGSDLVQDEDVLDTWFSSALWPFSTLGWPDETRDLRAFYPTSVLVTGFDIIFFWVARMMMMGLEFMDEVPFRHVYIHALVRDEDGRKMSKSTGNVIDPLDMIDRYGADALRFTLAVFAAMGRDIKLSESRIEGYKHFINKIWNAARFALMNLDQDVPALNREDVSGFSHRYILHELEQVKKQVSRALDSYHFNQAAQTLYRFVWHTYCDWYLEMIKNELSSQDPAARSRAQTCLLHSLSEILILLHPFIPFVSQEIWSHLPVREEENLAAAAFPALHPESEDPALGEDMEFFQGVVVSIRNIRSELNIAPSTKLEVLVQAEGRPAAFLEEQQEVICTLARLQSLTVQPEVVPPQAVASAVVQGCEVYVPLEGIVDFESELARLDKQLAKIDKDMQGLGKKLENENFVAKAPAEVVDKERSRLKELREKREKLAELQGRLQQCVA